MTEKMRTVCVGRYLVDVPLQAEVSMSQERIDGFAIHTLEESEAAFSARVAAREHEIDALGNGRDERGPGGMIAAHDLHIEGLSGRTLIHGRTRSHGVEAGQAADSEWVSIESHAHRQGLSISLSADYVDEADAKAAEALLARWQARGEDEVPRAAGFCAWRGVFAEPLPRHSTEHIVMQVALPGHPDLALSFSSLPGGGTEPGLLARAALNDARIGAETMLRITKLREHKRSINGIDGEEQLIRAREFNFTTTYGFNWETQGLEKDLLRPYLSLELQTGVSERAGGKPVDTSLHEDALLALWDSIAASIRLRRSEPPSASGTPPTPAGPWLGATASAGERCPQSGWWRCADAAPGMTVHGGQVQFLRQGDRMPQALLLPRQTVWQKLKRIQPSVESAAPTVWTLVERRVRPRLAQTHVLAAAAPGLDKHDSMEVEGATVSVGSHARTGEPCPASGWWRCVDIQALDGTRWFERGSVLPAATFQVPTGLSARASCPDRIQRRSAWQLLRHASAPDRPQDGPAPADGAAADAPPPGV